MTEHDFGSRSEFYTFAPDTLRDEFPDFEILQEVGKGSMGIVYEAIRKADQKRVALKVLPPSLTLTDRALARFLKEGEVMAKIEHDTIVRVYAHGSQGRLHFFCMEFVDGVSLQERLTVGPLPLRQAAELASQVGKALQFAHDRGVLHRDVKPGNLMLRSDGRVAITDFGLARETGTGSLTESGAIVGTPMYMAPEQIVGKRGAVDARADIYGLGATLYELTTGQPPFEGPTAQSVLKMVLEKEPLRPGRLRRDTPAGLEAIILQALEKEPARRYGSALEMAEDLDRFLAGERVTARLPSATRRAARTILKHPLLATLIAIILVLTVVSFVLLRNQRLQDLQAQLREVAIDFNRATSLDTMGLQPLTNQGRQTLLRRAKDHASSVLRQAPGRLETTVPALIWRARILNVQREHRLALEDLDKAEQLLDEDEPRRDILTYRIDTLQKLREPAMRARLQADLTTLLRIDPGRDTRLLVVDHLLIIAGEVSGRDRLVMLEQTESILSGTEDPAGEASARIAIAWARLLELQGRLEEAERAILRVTETQNSDPVGYVHAARIYRKVGKVKAAVAAENMVRALRGETQPSAGPTKKPPTKEQPVDMREMTEFLEQIERLTAGKNKKAAPPTSKPAGQNNKQ